METTQNYRSVVMIFQINAATLPALINTKARGSKTRDFSLDVSTKNESRLLRRNPEPNAFFIEVPESMLNHFFDLRSRDILPYNLADGSLQHFIAAATDAGDGRLYFVVRSYPDALSWFLVRIENANSANHRAEATRQENRRDVAIGARGRAADNLGSWGGAERHRGVFRRTLGEFVHQNHYLAWIMWLLWGQ